MWYFINSKCYRSTEYPQPQISLIPRCCSLAQLLRVRGKRRAAIPCPNEMIVDYVAQTNQKAGSAWRGQASHPEPLFSYQTRRPPNQNVIRPRVSCVLEFVPAFQGNTITLAHLDEPYTPCAYKHIWGVRRIVSKMSKVRLVKIHIHVLPHTPTTIDSNYCG